MAVAAEASVGLDTAASEFLDRTAEKCTCGQAADRTDQVAGGLEFSALTTVLLESKNGAVICANTWAQSGHLDADTAAAALWRRGSGGCSRAGGACAPPRRRSRPAL